MRLAAFALSALIAAAGSPVLAASLHEPPDPCQQFHSGHARAHCLARHPKPQFGDGSVHFRGVAPHGSANEGWEQDRGAK